MDKITRYIKINFKELIFLGFLNIILIFRNIYSVCNTYLSYSNFDLQAILTWDYSAVRNLIPYKDIYYPYGLLSYYKSENPILIFIYILIPLLIFNICFFILKKLFKQNFITYSLTFIFFLFIIFVSGLSSFNRYGISLAFTLLISLIFYLNIKSFKIYFLLGFIFSIIFWLVHDQGIYIYSVFFIFFIGSSIFDYRKLGNNKKFLYSTVGQLFLFIFGSLIGILIFILFLIKNNALNGFLYYFFVSLPEFPLLSKTPYFTSAFSVNNLFTTGVLSISILFIIIKLFINNKKSLATFLQIGLIILLLMFEQKNIIRSIQEQITFVSIILFSIVVWDASITYKKNIFKTKYKYIYIFILFSIFIVLFKANYKVFKTSSNFITSRYCFSSNVNTFKVNSKYADVINRLKSYKDFNNKIFSFPGDPIFYVLLNQIPPYYSSVYESSSLKSQNQIIDFMKNDIRYVVINMNNKSIQDEVPNYIRSNHELRFLLANYSIKEVVGSFIILKRKKNADFFNSKILNSLPEYKNYLLNINLESIPFSEGIHKKIIINNGQVIIKDARESNLNKYLKSNNTYSDNNILLLKSTRNQNKNIMLKIYSDNNLHTEVNLKSCKENYCVINLSNIPLFYKNRKINMIYINENIYASIVKMSDKDLKKLW